MPSNRELTDEAEALGRELGVSVDTERLTNRQLRRLVDQLYRQLEAQDASGPVEPGRYVVGSRALSTRTGIVAPGGAFPVERYEAHEVRRLIKSGRVVKL